MAQSLMTLEGLSEPSTPGTVLRPTFIVPAMVEGCVTVSRSGGGEDCVWPL